MPITLDICHKGTTQTEKISNYSFFFGRNFSLSALHTETTQSTTKQCKQQREAEVCKKRPPEPPCSQKQGGRGGPASDKVTSVLLAGQCPSARYPISSDEFSENNARKWKCIF